jgi:hypothetical protein
MLPSTTNSPTTPRTPPLSEIFSQRQFAARHPHLLNKSRIDWAVRNRETNGLEACGGTIKSPCGEVLIHEPSFIEWFLGRAKPRRLRRAAGGAA